MVKTRKSWREKLENPPEGLPKVVTGPPKWEKRFGGRRVLVATPLLVDGLIRKVGEGETGYDKSNQGALGKGF